jgi:seryl-tRNA synthetase
MDAPSIIAAPVLERAGFVENFPQQIMRFESHGRNVPHFLSPAACFHVYPRLQGAVLGQDLLTTRVACHCARYEEGVWNPPFRLSAFNMLEFVHIGSREAVVSRRDQVVREIEDLFHMIGIPGQFEVATDAFFLSKTRGARLIQKLKGLKREFRVNVDGEPVAVASVNLHEDYFGSRFEIGDRRKEPAWSFCAAFGIERLVACGLMQWGASPVTWPEVLR